MGVNLSKNQYKSIYDQATNMMTKVINEYTTTVNTVSSLNQKINVINGPTGVMDCGAVGLVMSNDGKSTVTALYSLTNTSNSATYNDLVSKMTDAITNSVKATNTGLNIFQANVSINDTEIQNKIRTTINNELRNTVNQVFNTISTNNQEINFTNYGKVSGAKCNFNNVAVTSMFVDMMLNNTAQNLVQNYSEVASSNTNTNTAELSNEGVSLASLLGFGKFGGIIAIVVILAIVGVVGGVMLKKKKG